MIKPVLFLHGNKIRHKTELRKVQINSPNFSRKLDSKDLFIAKIVKPKRD